MALPELVRLSVEKKLSEYCRRKVSPHVSERLRLGFRFRGNTVTLFESRPIFDNKNKWIDVVFAQFRFDSETAYWTLYWADRNSRWHNYIDLDPSRNFEKLLKEVNDDHTGIFR